MIAPLFLFVFSSALAGFAYLISGPVLSDLLLLALIMALGSLVLLTVAAFNRPVSTKISSPAKIAPRRVQVRKLRANPKPWILIDGSNVLHWRDGQPQMATVKLVVAELTLRGFSPGVMFDANVGYKVGDRYQDDAELARQLGLPEDRVLVVPKGTPADTFLLQAARSLKARVVTNDRYRDWAEDHPEVLTPGFLIRGGFGNAGLWFDAALTQTAVIH